MTLKERLDNLETTVSKYSFKKNIGYGTDVGYFVFDYPAEDELLIRERVRYLYDKYNDAGNEHRVVVFDLYEIIIKILNDKGYIEKCFDLEKKRGFEQLSNAICKSLRITSDDNLIVKYLKENTPDNAVVLLVGIGKCFPILRSHSVLNSLHHSIDNSPVILFYPGKYENQELILFDEIKDDNFYRANKL